MHGVFEYRYAWGHRRLSKNSPIKKIHFPLSVERDNKFN